MSDGASSQLIDCIICLESFPRAGMVELPCGHLHCAGCTMKMRELKCSQCREYPLNAYKSIRQEDKDYTGSKLRFVQDVARTGVALATFESGGSTSLLNFTIADVGAVIFPDGVYQMLLDEGCPPNKGLPMSVPLIPKDVVPSFSTSLLNLPAYLTTWYLLNHAHRQGWPISRVRGGAKVWIRCYRRASELYPRSKLLSRPVERSALEWSKWNASILPFFARQMMMAGTPRENLAWLMRIVRQDLCGDGVGTCSGCGGPAGECKLLRILDLDETKDRLLDFPVYATALGLCLHMASRWDDQIKPWKFDTLPGGVCEVFLMANNPLVGLEDGVLRGATAGAGDAPVPSPLSDGGEWLANIALAAVGAGGAAPGDSFDDELRSKRRMTVATYHLWMKEAQDHYWNCDEILYILMWDEIPWADPEGRIHSLVYWLCRFLGLPDAEQRKFEDFCQIRTFLGRVFDEKIKDHLVSSRQCHIWLSKVVKLCKERTDKWGAYVAGPLPKTYMCPVLRAVSQTLSTDDEKRLRSLHQKMEGLAEEGINTLSPSDRVAVVGRAGDKRARPSVIVDLCDDDDDGCGDKAAAAGEGASVFEMGAGD